MSRDTVSGFCFDVLDIHLAMELVWSIQLLHFFNSIGFFSRVILSLYLVMALGLGLKYVI